MRSLRLLASLCAGILVTGCTDPDAARVKSTTQASYDFETGRLTEITYDKNKNGRIDTWTKMEGARPISSRLDTNEDGLLDRWETYGPNGQVVQVDWERTPVPSATNPTPVFTGQPNATATIAPDGSTVIEYYEVSDVTGRRDITRREFYGADRAMTRAEEDADGDGLMDRFETYAAGVMRTVEFDENKPYDGKPDRRMTFSPEGGIVLIETEPDGHGGYLKKVVPRT